jgi:tRNA pseudouridine38-40 synthase
MVIAYEGSGFRGFARQPGQRTVSGELSRAISNFCRHKVDLVCAGRTDSGVHAQGQVVHADLDPSIDPVALKRAVNRQLSPEVVVRSLVVAPTGFDARHSATSRYYRYLVLEAPEPDPLLAGFVWHVPDALDLRAMRAAGDALLGEHDFSAFCRRPPDHPKDSPITRRVLDTRWSVASFLDRESGNLADFGDQDSGHQDSGHQDSGDQDSGDQDSGEPGRLLRFDIRATSFCHQMVRSIVGVLVEVGRGRMRPSDIPRLLASGNRQGAKVLAPPHGLCLIGVDYAASVGSGSGSAGSASAGSGSASSASAAAPVSTSAIAPGRIR